MYIALGFALHEIRQTATDYKELEFDSIDHFKPSLKIKGGVLKEVILF